MTRRGATRLMVAALLLAATGAGAGTKEVRVNLILQPDLKLNGSEKILIGPILVEPRGDAPVSTLDRTASREFEGYLRTLLRRRTRLDVLAREASLRPPSDSALELATMTDFWRELGERTGADYIVSAAIDVQVLDRAGYTTEKYVSPADGKTYFRQVLVEETGFKFNVLLLIFDGSSGDKVFQDQISDFKERSERKLNVYTDMFGDLFHLENRLAGVFVPRSVVAKRTLYTD